MSSPRIWFITGSSTGFGRQLTELILQKGENVVATARRPSALDDLKATYPASRLLVVKLDVNNKEEIAAAFGQAQEAFGRLDVVVNNAAWGALGEVEASRDEDVRAMFETNVWGAANVTREAVRFFRDVNTPVGGRLLQISSMAGFASMPSWGFYSASKHAFEALTEGLVSEIDPAWNIKITIIEPGGFRTEGKEKVVFAPEHPAYSNPNLPVTQMRKHWDSFSPKGDAQKGVDAFYKIASLENPPLRVPLGKDSIAMLRKKIASLTADVDNYEYLSEDLEVDE
ncbi:hypothetical protein TRAPUB_11317 [Trametes pubescens]|uniref:Oxidoreductase YusZ n=1 Tax=Trametes pubescens TaxID=154538 RepID=A0A1M2VX85_TRAPU|nr:hypothetical protein TRAPUB_11317 [Trametes pubescens]